MKYHLYFLLLLFNVNTSDAATGFEVAPDDPNDNHTISLDMLKVLLSRKLDDYDRRIRPRMQQQDTVEVKTGFALETIVEFDTTGQSMEVMGFFSVEWIDEVIVWDPADYNGSNVIRLPLTEIWYPELIITKAYEGKMEIGHVDLDIVKVSSNGRMLWVPSGVFRFLCDVHVEYYPFDMQICKLVFHVAGETSSSVLLTAEEKIDSTFFTENSEWNLMTTKTTIDSKYTTNYVTIQFEIERRAQFTVYTMILPLTSLSAINVFTFLVPIESGEKASVAITVFLAYGFFITITRDSLPHNSLQISYYVIYICALLVLSMGTVVYVVIESRIYTTVGNKPWRTMKRKNKVSPTKTDVEVYSIDGDVFDVEEDDEEECMIWAKVLKRVDTVCFSICFLSVVTFSAVLWTLVVRSH